MKKKLNKLTKSIIKGQGHVCPIHTHVINKHIYNHTYTPEYSCSEENQVINNDPGSCCGFANNGWM